MNELFADNDKPFNNWPPAVAFRGPVYARIERPSGGHRAPIRHPIPEHRMRDFLLSTLIQRLQKRSTRPRFQRHPLQFSMKVVARHADVRTFVGGRSAMVEGRHGQTAEYLARGTEPLGRQVRCPGETADTRSTLVVGDDADPGHGHAR